MLRQETQNRGGGEEPPTKLCRFSSTGPVQRVTEGPVPFVRALPSLVILPRKHYPPEGYTRRKGRVLQKPRDPGSREKAQVFPRILPAPRFFGRSQNARYLRRGVSTPECIGISDHKGPGGSRESTSFPFCFLGSPGSGLEPR